MEIYARLSDHVQLLLRQLSRVGSDSSLLDLSRKTMLLMQLVIVIDLHLIDWLAGWLAHWPVHSVDRICDSNFLQFTFIHKTYDRGSIMAVGMSSGHFWNDDAKSPICDDDLETEGLGFWLRLYSLWHGFFHTLVVTKELRSIFKQAKDKPQVQHEDRSMSWIYLSSKQN